MGNGQTFTKQFKEDAVKYKKEHPELTLVQVASNLGISLSALKHQIATAKENQGAVPTRGTENFSSDEAKEIARLEKKLCDTKDALEILKKAINLLGK